VYKGPKFPLIPFCSPTRLKSLQGNPYAKPSISEIFANSFVEIFLTSPQITDDPFAPDIFLRYVSVVSL
jgi:hypothetical protein